MLEDEKRSAFDKLVAGMDTTDRFEMLQRIRESIAPAVQLVETEGVSVDKSLTLHLRFKEESPFYRFFLWLRGIIEKKDSEKIYNEDVLASMARRINRDHPGVVDHRNGVLDTVFFQHLKALKSAADFFKPYFSIIDDNAGDFYVFLSSFVTPELAEQINSEADPFSLDFDVEPGPDVKNTLLRKLDNILKNIDGNAKSSLYYSVSALNWLRQFTKLPYLHFMAQFTNVTGEFYTCPYRLAVNDFDTFAALFSNTADINNELLEAMLLFTQKKDFAKNAMDKDIERAIKEFLAQANQNFATIQMFISTVPILKVGKILNADYDWTPGTIEGVEAWFPNFRSHWRKIIDIRWNDWIRERKKKMLETYLNRDFGLSVFPVLTYRPWQSMWMRVPFACELTGGFLSWFSESVYDEIIEPLNEVMMEGIFIRSENRTEYSEGLNLLAGAISNFRELVERLSPNGEYGERFEEFAMNKIRSLQVQNQIDSMMVTTEAEIRDDCQKISRGATKLEKCLHGIVDEEKDGIHENLQNISMIKGHQNRAWRDNLKEIKKTLQRVVYYLSELEPIDAATGQE